MMGNIMVEFAGGNDETDHAGYRLQVSYARVAGGYYTYVRRERFLCKAFEVFRLNS